MSRVLRDRAREQAREALTYALSALYDPGENGLIAALLWSGLAAMRVGKLCSDEQIDRALKYVQDERA
jgi:hypothetical protein